ncbi:MAG: hypothetical protein JSV44_08710 [Candidatus Zixiibacteriota bacterium]|nr:MAG: hypothetical protein JSV44_08710 [candidate division Zixibacteria bacterium]
MTIPKYIIPMLVIIALFGGFFLRSAFTQPSTEVSFGSGEGKRLVCIVEGVRCKGTAAFFTSLYDGVSGITGITTFASEHKAVIMYDPGLITRDSIRAIMEAPIPLRDGTSQQIFRCISME